LGIKKFRFYIKCCVCSAEITFKTDPKNSDYECEYGASRNFEIWRETNEAIATAKREREEEDKLDSMKSLENRTLDSKIEMDVLDALDEMRAINQRHERVDTNALLDSLSKADEKVLISGLTKSDEELLKTIKFRLARERISILSFTSSYLQESSPVVGCSILFFKRKFKFSGDPCGRYQRRNSFCRRAKINHQQTTRPVKSHSESERWSIKDCRRCRCQEEAKG
jgi:hypothetical protein